MSSDRHEWVSIENDFPDHPKIVAAGAPAGWAHVSAICYADRYRTNGFIPQVVAWRIVRSDPWMDAANTSYEAKGKQTSSKRQANVKQTTTEAKDILLDRLVETCLWEEVPGGYQIHDYLKHQRNSDEIRALRQVRAEAGRRGGLASAEAKRSKRQANAKQTPSRGQAEEEKETFVPTETSYEVSSGTHAKVEAKRSKDELWDIFIEEAGEVETDSERGRRNKALKELRTIGASPDDLRFAIGAYRKMWPDITLTASGVVANWTMLMNGASRTPAFKFHCSECGIGVNTEQRLTEHMENVHGIWA